MVSTRTLWARASVPLGLAYDRALVAGAQLVIAAVAEQAFLGWDATTWVAVGTLALAAVTALVVVATTIDVRTSRRSLQATLRPLLAEVPLSSKSRGEIAASDATVEIRVPVRNTGSGLALIVRGPVLHWGGQQRWDSVARVPVLPAGEESDFIFWVTYPSSVDAQQAASSTKTFGFEVDYTDIDGSQRTRTKAKLVRLDGTSSYFAFDTTEWFRLRKLRWRKPFAKLSGRGSSQ
jgi:hypothetical protein